MIQRFDFAIDERYVPVLLAFGATPARCFVQVTRDQVVARFGFFRAVIDRRTISGVTVHDGPFDPLKAVGVRYSPADRSVTFGSSTGPMAEIRVDEPLTIRPPGLTRHPALWLSVSEPDRLAAALSGT